MYIPEHFSIKSEQGQHKIIQTHPLGALVMMTPAGLDANHIPFEFDPVKGLLTGHVARANPVWQQCGNGMDALVIFRGEESYISPNWYPSKHEFHRQVPTWNGCNRARLLEPPHLRRAGQPAGGAGTVGGRRARCHHHAGRCARRFATAGDAAVGQLAVIVAATGVAEVCRARATASRLVLPPVRP